MKEITKIFPNNIKYNLSKIGDIKKQLFFDIETTGLSPKNSNLYLIGCISIDGDKLIFKQWFSESLSEETVILQAFYEYAAGFDTLIHFKGDGFDLPYIKECAKQYYLFNPLENYKSIDIYKQIRYLKKPLSLSHMNQKSLEEFLGLYRKDLYDGGTLIRFYYDYIESKNKSILADLLLHNEEDLLGMLTVVEMLSFIDFFNSDFILYKSRRDEQKLYLVYKSSEYINYDLQIDSEVNIDISDNKLNISIPILKDELKYFFDNYKDYYYLTIEDYAIHKSIGEFVDKAVKKKATKQTAYIKQISEFIPCYGEVLIGENFRKDYKSKQKYIDLSKLNFDDKTFFNRYLVEMLKQFKLLK